MNYLNEFLFLIVLYLPTFIANWVPVVIKNIPPFNIYNKAISEKYLWKNKTYRWFISWIVFAIITSIILYKVLNNFDGQIIINYYNIVLNLKIAIITWFLQWFWALFWDSFKSFFKRKLWKKPWSSWPIVDGIDYIIWSILFFSFIFTPSSVFWYLFLIFFAPIISSVSNILSYLLRWKSVWY